MNRISTTALLILAGLTTAGCHAQANPTSSPKVALTWTAPVASGTWTGCTTDAPCTYIIFRETVASASTSCDANTSSNYKQIGTSATTSYTDNGVSQGGYVCWIVQTSQGTPVLYSDPSAPSNNSVALAVPAVPTAPGMPSATTESAQAEKPVVRPALPAAQTAWLDSPAPLRVHARLM